MTVRDVIDRLTRKAVIDRLGVSSSQISNWLADGKIPAHWYDPLDRMASEQGWQVPRDVFAWRGREDAA